MEVSAVQKVNEDEGEGLGQGKSTGNAFGYGDVNV